MHVNEYASMSFARLRDLFLSGSLHVESFDLLYQKAPRLADGQISPEVQTDLNNIYRQILAHRLNALISLTQLSHVSVYGQLLTNFCLNYYGIDLAKRQSGEHAQAIARRARQALRAGEKNIQREFLFSLETEHSIGAIDHLVKLGLSRQVLAEQYRAIASARLASPNITIYEMLQILNCTRRIEADVIAPDHSAPIQDDLFHDSARGVTAEGARDHVLARLDRIAAMRAGHPEPADAKNPNQTELELALA